MRRYLLIFLVLCSVCFAADVTKYVCTNSGNTAAGNYLVNGNDTTGDGTLAKPYATVEKAVDDNAGVGSGDTMTVVVKSGDTLADDKVTFGATHTTKNFDIISSDPGTSWTFFSTTANGHFEFNTTIAGAVSFTDMVIGPISDGALNNIIFYQTNAGMNLTLTNCTISTTDTTAECIDANADAGNAATRDFTLNNTSITTVVAALVTKDFDTVTIENGSTITNSGAIAAVILEDKTTRFIVDASTITSTANNGIQTDVSAQELTSGTDFIIRNGSTISGLVGVKVLKFITNVILTDSTFLAPINSGSSAAIKIGDDTEADVTGANAGDSLGQVQILNNTITATTHRALHIQFGCNGASILNNVITGDNHTFELDSDGCEVAYNTSTGNLPIFIMGGYNHIHNNTTYDDENAFLITLANGAAFNDFKYPTGNRIYNNIFVTTGASAFAYTDADGNGGNDSQDRGEQSDEMADFVDFNCYFNEGGGDAFSLGSDSNEQTGNTIALMQAAWQTATSGGTAWNAINENVNDQNSIIADPLFVDAANGDFRLKIGSPLLRPAHKGLNGGVMGQFAPYALPEQESRSRYGGSPIYR